ncbi:PREDICTED: LOB domain-containing protein 22-like [Ipomoea nil]|uniref:LOB domain-containing protein 22-like n=1 Tax=Ipomoea nil TaxID=35883 RepID=UPI000901B0C4|nr:PREDICTED: LOB domain-containing protein 22-like [Ipomoea nil]
MVNTANNPTNTYPKASVPSPPPPPYTLSFKHTAETHASAAGGGGGACAVCKHQRRKCPPDCPLAPHFPAYKQRDFLNVHKLFGVRNLTRALAAIDKRKSHDFMVSVIYEANARAADPVGGCLGLIHNLNQQLKYSTVELDIVNQQLAFYRSRQMAAAAFDPSSQLGSSSNTPDFVRNDKQHITDHRFHRFPEKQQFDNGEVSFAGSSVKLSDGIGLIDNSIKAKEEGEEDLKNAASKFSLRK